MNSTKFNGVLLLVVCLAVHVTNSAAKQPDLLDLITHAIGDVAPCMNPCLLKDIRKTNAYLAPCINQSLEKIAELVKNTTIKTYTDLYNKVLVKTGKGPSLYCKFYDETASCFHNAIHGLCGSSVAAQLKKLDDGLRSYGNCEDDKLPILECMAHPDLMRHYGYVNCTWELVKEVYRKFVVNGYFTWQTFYQKAIIDANGLGFRVLVTNFGLCVDSAVTMVKGCGIMRGHALKQVEVVRDFLDYTDPDNGTDALKCFTNPDVLNSYVRCEVRFVFDILLSPTTIVPSKTFRSLSKLAQYLQSNAAADAWSTILLWFRNHQLSFNSCIRTSTERFCDYGWSTQETIRILQPTDKFFTDLRPPVKELDCEGSMGRMTTPSPSAGATSIPNIYIFTTGLALFRTWP